MNVERKIPFDKPNKFPRYRKSDVLAYMKKIQDDFIAKMKFVLSFPMKKLVSKTKVEVLTANYDIQLN